MRAGRYFYHIGFELYENPSPAAAPREGKSGKHAGQISRADIYLPPPRTDIFTSNLPAHTKPVEPKRTRHGSKAESELKALGFGTQVDATRRRRNTIIDCGPSRADPTSGLRADQRRIAYIGETNSGLQTRPKEHTIDIAVRDWRFSPIRMEGIDMGSARENHISAASMAGLSQATSSETTNPIPSVRGGINAGPRSHTTKAKIESLPARLEDGTVKNTELGWGVVHLYRDGEESPELGSLSTSQDGLDTKHSAAKAEDDLEEELDTTILCIPAVPSYMTPSDFLGWVGEKTREEVSHFRMVMTGRMNRYLVLMKFRDAKVARRWRQDWDGRVFGGMSVFLSLPQASLLSGLFVSVLANC
jgi:BRCA1-associated protein